MGQKTIIAVQAMYHQRQGFHTITSELGCCRYNLMGDVAFKAAQELHKPEVVDFFCHLIKRLSPKTYTQALAEVTVTRRFLENFSGDSVRVANQWHCTTSAASASSFPGSCLGAFGFSVSKAMRPVVTRAVVILWPMRHNCAHMAPLQADLLSTGIMHTKWNAMQWTP